MTSPPGNENAALAGGALKKTYDVTTVADSSDSDNLFPVNVQALTGASGEFHWRKSAGDLIGRCPLCQGKLIVHESEPWALCVGETHCSASTMPFNELLVAIRRAA